MGAAAGAGAEKKELTREQLLLYIKKLKVRPCYFDCLNRLGAPISQRSTRDPPTPPKPSWQVRVKELEGQVDTAKSAQAALQSQQVALEEEAGALRASDEALQARLVTAAEEVHAAQRAGEQKVS